MYDIHTAVIIVLEYVKSYSSAALQVENFTNIHYKNSSEPTTNFDVRIAIN